MANRDVKLIIRAKNDASREIDSVSDSLKQLAADTAKAGSSASKADDLLGRLGQEFGKLNAQIAGLKSLDKIAGYMDRASRGVENLKSDFDGMRKTALEVGNALAASAENVGRLATEYKALSTAQQGQKADLEAARDAIGRNSKAQKELSAAQKEYKALLRQRVNTPQNDEAIVSARMRLEEAKRAVADNQLAYDRLKVSVAGTSAQMREVGSALKAAEREHASLGNTALDVAAKEERMVAALQKGESEYAGLKDKVSQYASALGVASTEQGELAGALSRAVPEADRLAKSLGALQRYSTGGKSFVDPKTASALRAQRQEIENTEAAWKSLEAEARRLAAEMKGVAQPSEQQAAAFRQVTAAAKAAKTEYNAQVAVLARLQGSVRSTFAEFAAATAPLDKTNAAIQKNIENVNALTAAMSRYSTGTGGFANADMAAKMREQANVVEQARQRWQLLMQEAQRLSAVMHSAGNATAQQSAQFRQVSAAANAAEKEFKEAAVALRQLETGSRGGFLSGINRESRQAMSVFQRLRGEVLSLATAYAGLYGTISNVGGTIAAYQKLEAAQNRLGAVFKQNSEQTRNELAWLERQAARLGIDFGTLSNTYSKFAVAANAANFSAEGTRKIFLRVAEAGRVNKLSMEDMSLVFLALEQMISKGKIQSEELRQQLGERLPGAFTIMADALGIATDELGDMMKKGEVLANESNLLKFAGELEKRFGPQLAEALRSTTTAIGHFQNNLFQAQLLFARGGFIEAFNRLLEKMNAWFQSDDGVQFFLSLGAAAGRIVDVLGIMFDHLDVIVAVVQTLVALKMAAWLTGLANNAIAASRNLSSLATQTSGLVNANNIAAASTTKFYGVIGSAGAALKNYVMSISAVQRATTGFSGVVGSFGSAVTSTRAGLMAATAASGAWSGALAILRGGLLAARVAVSGLLAALGGPAGIAIAIGTYFATDLIAKWAGEVDGATEALERHKRLMGEIVSGYEKQAEGAKNWAKALENTPLDQLQANARKVRDEFEAARKALVDFGASPIKAVFGGWSGIADQVAVLRNELGRGEVSLNDFKAKLESLYAGTANRDAQQYVETVLDMVRKLEELSGASAQAEDAVRKKRDALDGLRGTLSDVKSPLEALTEAAGGNANAFAAGSEAAEKYKASLDGIKGMVPELANELARLKDQAKLDEFVKGLGFGPRTAEQDALIRSAQAGIDAKYTNYEARYTAERGTPQGKQMEELVKAVTLLAEKMGVSAKDLLTVMSYETSGTLDPWKAGPTTQYGQHRGLIQWGEPQAAKYGVNADTSITDQVNAAGKYLEAAGVKAGDGLLQIYAAINAGNAKNIHASDANNGGAPGTVLDKVSGQMEGHKARAEGLLKAYAGANTEAEKLAKTQEKSAEAEQKATEATKKRIEDQKFEISQQDLKNVGKERQAAIEAAARQAQQENKNIGAEELALIKEQAGALWDKQQLKKAEKEENQQIKDALKEVNLLEQARNQLLQQRKALESQGDQAGVDRVNAKIAETNTKLQEAIDKAIAMQQSLGGATADATISKLEAMRGKIEAVGDGMQRTAMTAQQMSDSIYSTLESGIIGMFDTFAQAIANGENAVEALWTAFRQFAANFLLQIAQMIIKQTLFNALQNFSKSLGGGLFSFLAMHSGGVVGSSGVGSGSRAVSPAWFGNAVRYHTGGVAGLKPDEVPTVLKEGEEVLTETDPRHRNNGGAAGTGNNRTKVVNMFDAASFLSEALNSAVGEEAILNFVRANPGAFRSAMG